VQQLWQLVERGAPQEPSDRRNAWIVRDLEQSVGFVESPKLVLQVIRPLDHGSELGHLEPLPVAADPRLLEQHGAR
jgi:hypothetical protein